MNYTLIKLGLKSNNGSSITEAYVNPRTCKFFSDPSMLTEEDLRYTSEKNRNTPILFKNKKPSKVKFYLGSACNYRCSYCRQWTHESTVVTHSDAEITDITNEIKRVSDMSKPGYKIQFWGGEPLLYMEDIIHITEKLPPNTRYHFISNGSLIDKEICDWLLKTNSQFTFSYDGPGQIRRGRNPLDDATVRECLLKLAHNKRDREAFMVSSVLTDKNMDIYELYNHHAAIFGDDVVMSKMELAIPYNDHAGAVANNTLKDHDLIEKLFEGLVKLDKEDKVTHIRGFEIAFKTFYGQHENPDFCIDFCEPKCGTANEKSVCFGWDKQIVPCQVFGGTDTIIGQLKDYPILSEPYLPMTMRNIPGCDCKNCLVVSLCRGLCPWLDQRFVTTNCKNKYIFYHAIMKYIFYKLGYSITSMEPFTIDLGGK